MKQFTESLDPIHAIHRGTVKVRLAIKDFLLLKAWYKALEEIIFIIFLYIPCIFLNGNEQEDSGKVDSLVMSRFFKEEIGTSKRHLYHDY